MKTPNVPLFAFLLAGSLVFSCKRDPAPADPPTPPPATLTSPACGHAACGDGYFVDAVPASSCAAGEVCALSLVLVATGDYHINDEYPYKFKGDDQPGLEFQGKSADGRGVFTKAAGDWTKADEKTGRMAVAFTSRAAAEKRVAGVFKLSVCSAQNCRLEQPRVDARVAVR
jgi:hypothetical protein